MSTDGGTGRNMTDKNTIPSNAPAIRDMRHVLHPRTLTLHPIPTPFSPHTTTHDVTTHVTTHTHTTHTHHTMLSTYLPSIAAGTRPVFTEKRRMPIEAMARTGHVMLYTMLTWIGFRLIVFLKKSGKNFVVMPLKKKRRE